MTADNRLNVAARLAAHICGVVDTARMGKCSPPDLDILSELCNTIVQAALDRGIDISSPIADGQDWMLSPRAQAWLRGGPLASVAATEGGAP